MKVQEDTGLTLDRLMTLVETAARTIENLQAANGALTRKMRSLESVAKTAAEEMEHQARQIEELEQAAAALRRDAHWARWFRQKYGSPHFSTFFGNIEREYRAEHPEMNGNAPSGGA